MGSPDSPPSARSWPLEHLKFLTCKNHPFPSTQISPGVLDRANDCGHQLPMNAIFQDGLEPP